MEYRRLGHTDIEVSAICLGTMTWGQQNSEEDAHEQLNYAVHERGVNFIDTAEVYPVPISRKLQGTTEIYIGNWLKKQAKRDEIILASKVAAGSFIRTRNPGNPPSFSKKKMREALQGPGHEPRGVRRRDEAHCAGAVGEERLDV